MIRTYEYSNVNPFEEHGWNKTFELHNQLPVELFEKILSYLHSSNDVKSAASINSLWNGKIIFVIKNQEFFKLSEFLKLLAENLSDQYATQKENFRKLIPTKDDYNNTFSTPFIKAKMDTIKIEIKNILQTVSDSDLKILFDSFTMIKKPKLFFEFFLLSKTHKILHDRLHVTVRRNDNVEVEDLLEKGAIPTKKLLDLAIQEKRVSVKTIKVLLDKCHIVPTEDNLISLLVRENNYYEGEKGPEDYFCPSGYEGLQEWSNRNEIFKILFKAGAIPTTKFLRHTLYIKRADVVFLTAVKKGFVPFENAIRLVTDCNSKGLIPILNRYQEEQK